MVAEQTVVPRLADQRVTAPGHGPAGKADPVHVANQQVNAAAAVQAVVAEGQDMADIEVFRDAQIAPEPIEARATHQRVVSGRQVDGPGRVDVEGEDVANQDVPEGRVRQRDGDLVVSQHQHDVGEVLDKEDVPDDPAEGCRLDIDHIVAREGQR